ncbi:MAG: flagellar biosynthesis anti-sigma factor FlgM [Oscillospiraceae bacterium]|jgi:anti-sigma28 factor (negative regulator of flagellin synthesis)|nr:flagellar biosynthesis anti-sigma factor FlgM [Oscillospiraceae bacterium]
MKIDPIGKLDYVKSVTPSAPKAAEIKPNRVRGTHDEVAVSAEARTFSKAFGAAKSALTESEQSSKIEAVKAQINAGTYFIEADKIAESILYRNMQNRGN